MDQFEGIGAFFNGPWGMPTLLGVIAILICLPKRPSKSEGARIEEYFRDQDVSVLRIDSAGIFDREKYNFRGRGDTLQGYYAAWTKDPDGVFRRCIMVLYGPPRPEIMMVRSAVVTNPDATVR
jgi:hypothetical protein